MTNFFSSGSVSQVRPGIDVAITGSGGVRWSDRGGGGMEQRGTAEGGNRVESAVSGGVSVSYGVGKIWESGGEAGREGGEIGRGGGDGLGLGVV